MSRAFELVAPFSPTGDQPEAIRQLVEGVKRGDPHQTLLGITGSGKTFTIANLINETQRPTLIMAPNKTLAAQLYGEFKELFPNNAVHYFVSYYDYYQPEAYVANTDTFIEKDSLINDEIDRMRHAATYALLSRKDVIIVASVSCIYGIGAQDTYGSMTCELKVDQTIDRDTILGRLVELQYERNDYDFHRGTFRVRGDSLEIFPPYESDTAIRIEWFGDEIEAINTIDPLRGKTLDNFDSIRILPASHYATPKETLHRAIETIRVELQQRLTVLTEKELLLERQRLEQRTMYDLECIEEMGYCNGIENYSRHLTGAKAGEPPPTLMDYFPDDYLLIIDESHQTVPQVQAMFRGDRARKTNLVDYGFRLPSALDNRPLKFNEWQQRAKQVVYVSATPAEYELEKSDGVVITQIIRPTGLLDPPIEVRPVGHQVDDLLKEIKATVKKKERVLVTTLTKRMAEDLTDYLSDAGVKVRYLHSEVDTLDRIRILRDLRMGEFDVLVGINLLREGLDIPEVSLVAILDADKEGFLRSARSLIQTVGRAARNLNGRVIFYADRITKSMKEAIDTTEARRKIQMEHNNKHGVTPRSASRNIKKIKEAQPLPKKSSKKAKPILAQKPNLSSPKALAAQVTQLRDEMKKAAKELDFETAAQLRDKALELEQLQILMG